MRRTPDLARAATMAYRCLLKTRATLPVDPLAMLHRCRSTRVMTVDQAADALGMPKDVLATMCSVTDAWTYRLNTVDGPSRLLVLYHTDGHPGRRRFSLAHELAHIVLGHTGSHVWEEREADCFASHLLCPRPALVRLMQQRGGLYADDVAWACFVSRSCTEMLERMPMPSVEPVLLRQVDELLRDAPKPDGSPQGQPLTPTWLPNIMQSLEAPLISDSDESWID